MEYYAYLEMSGGCDYTIACGKRLVYLCDDSDKIEESLKKELSYYESCDSRFSKVTIFNVSSSDQYDIEEYYRKEKEEEQKVRDLTKEHEEIEQLIKLKAKYPQV